MDESTKVGIYCRVSTQEQKKSKSINNQVEFAEKYCDLHSHEIVKWYKDDGVSGTLPFKERPAGRKLLYDIQNNSFETLLVLKIDRLARDTSLLLEIHEKLDERGIALKSMTEAFDTGSPTGKFTMTMFASIAALERETILERSERGKVRNVRKGKWPGGTPPLGYQINDDGYLEIEPEGAEIVRKVFKLYTEDDMATTKLADYLNAQDVPTAAQLKGTHPGNKGIWRPSSVSRILSKKIYKGEFIFREDTEDEIVVDVPEIVSEETWQKASNLRNKNKTFSLRGSKRLYLLRGLIKCGECGLAYVGDGSSTRNYSYYRCNGSRNVNKTLDKRCKATSLRAEMAEDIVWNDVKKLIKNPGDLIQKLTERLKKKNKEQKPVKEELESIQNQINDKKQGRERIINLHRRNLIDEEETEKELKQLEKEISVLKEHRDILLNQKNHQNSMENKISNVKDLLLRLQDEVDEASPETKRKLIKTFVESITVNTLKENGKNVPELIIQYRFENNSKEFFYDQSSYCSAAPFGPNIPNIIPLSTLKFTPSKAFVSLKYFFKFDISITFSDTDNHLTYDYIYYSHCY
jgi:site-specific DNA recombinase